MSIAKTRKQFLLDNAKRKEDLAKRLPCFRRSETSKKVGCATCGGSVQIEVFDCQLYTRCTLRNKTSLIMCCETCSDRKESDV